MKQLIFGLLLLSFFSASLPAFAQEGSPAAGMTPVAYELPYPGILPDSPWYQIKMIRDRVVSMLISDPVKKAEFNLLQADKRLQAGVYLLQKDDPDIQLALTTISKGENYFHEAIQHVKNGKKQGFYTGNIANTMVLASAKHKEVIGQLVQDIPGSEADRVKALTRQVDQIGKDVSSLRPR